MLAIVAALVLCSFVVERLTPARQLPKVRGWWWRVIALNGMQLGIAVTGLLTWDNWFKQHKILALGEYLHPILGGLLTYLIMSFVFYWWHRWRHEVRWLWRLFHQVHHSPQRIEALMTFYKHPLEMLANSLLIGLITYVLLGMNIAAAGWALAFSCSSELFFHMNIQTPHWLGYLIQRPEMHRVHHQRGEHKYNYADLPIWDMLFGTFRNPTSEEHECGFGEDKELQLGEMLWCRDVHEDLDEPDIEDAYEGSKEKPAHRGDRLLYAAENTANKRRSYP